MLMSRVTTMADIVGDKVQVNQSWTVLATAMIKVSQHSVTVYRPWLWRHGDTSKVGGLTSTIGCISGVCESEVAGLRHRCGSFHA